MSKNSEKPIAVEVKDLSKHFRLPIEQARGIKQAVINRFKGIKGYKEQKVLRDVSFKVEKGDFFGIVGRNGSGKSTLLKLISNIYLPDSGSVTINGSLVSFIELGVGFNPELTGRENVYLNGALLGFSTEEVDKMYDDIVDFAELGEFMDQKLKNYSSGMQVRLAFSCAIRAKSDILVLDEVLAVGDEAFQRKCNNYFEQISKDKNQTIILVTHNMDAVKRYCNKAILIDNGKIVTAGNPVTVSNQYSKLSYELDRTEKNDEAGEYPVGLSEQVSNMKVQLVSESVVENSDKLVFDVKYRIHDDTPCFVGISISKGSVSIIEHNTIEMPTQKAGSYLFRYEYALGELRNGEYQITGALFKYNKDDLRERQLLGFTGDLRAANFSIVDSGTGGLLVNRGKWTKK